MTFSENKLFGLLQQLYGHNEGKKLPGFEGARLAVGVDSLDDAAVIDLQEVSVVLASDFVRGPRFHLFKRGVLTYYDAGYYLAIANISDIAAMGVLPAALLTTIRYGKDEMTEKDLSEVLRGIADACTLNQTVVIGGDLGSYDVPVLAATAVGFAPRGQYLRRSGARPGDTVFMSGYAGFAGSALFYFMQRDRLGLHLSDEEERSLASAWKRPIAQVGLGYLLAKTRRASACQDVSDGLRTTVEQMSAASNVHFVIDEARLPIHPVTAELARQAHLDAVGLCLSDSVDFGLVFTAEDPRSELIEVGREAGIDLSPIGSVGEGSGCTLRRRSGELEQLKGIGWAHQVEDITELLAQSLKA